MADEHRDPVTHVVAEGETLSRIAEMYYKHGDEAHWKRIYDANQHVIGSDPDYILPGQRLLIPPAHGSEPASDAPPADQPDDPLNSQPPSG